MQAVDRGAQSVGMGETTATGGLGAGAGMPGMLATTEGVVLETVGAPAAQQQYQQQQQR